MQRRRLALVVPLLVVPFAVAACGGGGGSSSVASGASGASGDEAAVTTAIQDSATSTDPSTCTTLETQAFVEQSTFKTGQDAVKTCQENASNHADSVDVTNVSVKGTKATADAAITGGSLDGQTLTVQLVNDGGQWKLNHIVTFVKFDRASFLKAFQESLTTQGQLNSSQIHCVLSTMSQGSDKQIQQLMLSGSQSELSQVFGGC
jgi:hypothetical protein